MSLDIGPLLAGHSPRAATEAIYFAVRYVTHRLNAISERLFTDTPSDRASAETRALTRAIIHQIEHATRSTAKRFDDSTRRDIVDALSAAMPPSSHMASVEDEAEVDAFLAELESARH